MVSASRVTGIRLHSLCRVYSSVCKRQRGGGGGEGGDYVQQTGQKRFGALSLAFWNRRGGLLTLSQFVHLVVSDVAVLVLCPSPLQLIGRFVGLFRDLNHKLTIENTCLNVVVKTQITERLLYKNVHRGNIKSTEASGAFLDLTIYEYIKT